MTILTVLKVRHSFFGLYVKCWGGAHYKKIDFFRELRLSVFNIKNIIFSSRRHPQLDKKG